LHIDGAEQVERRLYGSPVIRDPESDAKLGLPELLQRLLSAQPNGRKSTTR